MISIFRVLIFQLSLFEAMPEYTYFGIKSEDPKELKLENKHEYRTVSTHFFMWHRHTYSPLLHLVVFHQRSQGSYLWFGPIMSSKTGKAPVDVSRLVIGKHAGSIQRFAFNLFVFFLIFVSDSWWNLCFSTIPPS